MIACVAGGVRVNLFGAEQLVVELASVLAVFTNKSVPIEMVTPPSP